eukprot:1171086-Prymnesium_polylepis.1
MVCVDGSEPKCMTVWRMPASPSYPHILAGQGPTLRSVWRSKSHQSLCARVLSKDEEIYLKGLAPDLAKIFFCAQA